ncbi:MAG: glycerophosphodiester phosphodiesterase family protein, partial [Planctomycetota bacterium]
PHPFPKKMNSRILLTSLLFAGAPLLSAHPGYTVETVPFEKGIDAQVGGIDVLKDGRLVVHHDASFDRYYGDSRKVADLTWVQIKQLRSTPGDLRPLDLEEFAAACHGKIALMLDTKGPDHEVAFFQEMERILKRHELLATALVIGTEQSKQYFHGKAKTSVNRRELEKAIRSAEEASRLYFLFEHGDMTDETIALAQRHGVQIVPSINIFHYPQEQHLQRAETDIRRLRRLGVRCFQIDSAYEASCRP